MFFGPFCMLFGGGLLLGCILGPSLLGRESLSGWGIGAVIVGVTFGIFCIIFGALYTAKWFKTTLR